MTQEEKAIAYDEAIRKIKGMMPNWGRLSYNGKTFLQDIVSIFPELKGNEYESTRKRIIALVNAHGQGRFKESMLAWLEKLKVFTEHGDGLYHFANSEFTYVGNPTCVKKLYEHKPTWAEADDKELKIAINALKNIGLYNSADWLITLKQRIGE